MHSRAQSGDYSITRLFLEGCEVYALLSKKFEPGFINDRGVSMWVMLNDAFFSIVEKEPILTLVPNSAFSAIMAVG